MPLMQDGSQYMNQCEFAYGAQHKECRPFVCTYQSLPGRGLDGQNNWALSGDAKDCQVLWSPFWSPKEAQIDEKDRQYQPVAYDGVPINYQMESFPDRYIPCQSDNDLGNEAIKKRSLWNQRGRVELSERPLYKRCGPSTISITRKGDMGSPVSRDGIIRTAENLINPDTESDLWNLNTYLVQGDTAVKSPQNQYCARSTLNSRYVITNQLNHLYNKSSINPDLFSRQHYTEYDTRRNVDWKTPHVFNNNTKSKISV